MTGISGKFAAGGLKLPDHKYEILSIADIKDDKIKNLVKEVLDVFEDVSTEQCEIMLSHFKWDPDQLLEKYLEADSLESFLQKYEIDLDLPLSDEAIVDSYIQAKPSYKWCPNKLDESCDCIVKNESADDIWCKCDLSYCFKCKDIAHSPFPCILIEEWKQQVVQDEPLCNENGVVCPQCREYSSVVKLDPDFFCTQCRHTFFSRDNILIANDDTVLRQYKWYLELLKIAESLRSTKTNLDKIGDGYEFLKTALKYAQTFVQKLLPLPAFSFFLDKDYLFQYPETCNKLQILDLHNDGLNDAVIELMKIMEISPAEYAELTDVAISKQQEINILNALHAVQQKLDTFFDFIKETGEYWVFKIPELRLINDTIFYQMDQLRIVDACN